MLKKTHMKTLFTLTKNTFRETIRDRILFVIIFFALAFIVSSVLMAEISARQNEKIIIDFGLAMINIFGVLITIFVGTNLVYKEIDRKTIFMLLSKPINRSTFILSKFFGLGAVLFLITFLMTIIFFLLAPFKWGFLLAILMMYFSFLLLLAVVLFFASFMQPMLSAFASLLVYIVGYITVDLKAFVENNQVSVFFQKFGDFIYYLWPNFEILNLKNIVVYDDFAFSFADGFYAILMTVLFIFVLLSLGSLIFSRREF